LEKKKRHNKDHKVEIKDVNRDNEESEITLQRSLQPGRWQRGGGGGWGRQGGGSQGFRMKSGGGRLSRKEPTAWQTYIHGRTRRRIKKELPGGVYHGKKGSCVRNDPTPKKSKREEKRLRCITAGVTNRSRWKGERNAGCPVNCEKGEIKTTSSQRRTSMWAKGDPGRVYSNSKHLGDFKVEVFGSLRITSKESS